MWSIHHTLDIIGDIIPYLIFFIFVTSMAFSWLFAHYLSKPMIQISNSSKKMQLRDDLTLEDRYDLHQKFDELVEVLKKEMHATNRLVHLIISGEDLDEEESNV